MTVPTPQQQSAIDARGNVLVSAGAGAGKTRTLVDRCLAWILSESERGSVDEVLMVTFTEAAATEMRQRLRQGLEAAYEAAPSARLLKQLALLDTAHISTLHSFCFHLVSQHFFELNVEGQAGVLSAERAKLLASQALDSVLDRVYEGKLPGAAAIQEFIKAHGGDWDKPAREIVRRIHAYRHSLRDPDGWLARQRERFSRQDAGEWRQWLMDETRQWLDKAGQWKDGMDRAACAAALEAIVNTPKKPKAQEHFFAEAAFLQSVCAMAEGDPLEEDWSWARGSMLALLDLTEAFGAAYAQAKRDAGGLDFGDLEQYALRALSIDGVAEQWRRKLRLLFVDEYQDINGAQEAIIQALGRPGGGANRFLVGDVKQSIYRFRLTDPRIFLERQRQWSADGGEGNALALMENFRSHESIVDFANDLFTGLMRHGVGGVTFDEGGRIVFGDRAKRAEFTTERSGPRVEARLLEPAEEVDDDGASGAELEARMIARRLAELKTSEPATKWGDMAILLRSPRNKAEAYVKAFAAAGVPLTAARGGFYETMEARDLLNLLRTLDNPLQDLPLLGVLRSPFGGFTARDLAVIRIGREKGRFWDALSAWEADGGGKGDELRRKAAAFLARFREWRRLARQTGVASCVERALDQTHYLAWTGALERGEQRRANVERFLQLTRDFDAERGEGLYRFLKLVEAQEDSEVDVEPAAAPVSDAVRLMSIHQSKGLEFPIVVLADLSKKFNFSDATGRVILDEQLGLCPQIKPPGAAQFYPSLAYWMAQRRQRRETLGEELRLLYVAVTRAKQRLILAGTATAERREKWSDHGAALSSEEDVLRARSYLDWFGAWITAAGGQSPLCAVHIEKSEASATRLEAKTEADAEDIESTVLQRLEWACAHAAAAREPAKTSVTALRRQLAAVDEDESARWSAARRAKGSGGAEAGSAHHAFLELVALDRIAQPNGLAGEAARLRREGRLSAEQTAALDMEALAAFWKSTAGLAFLGHAKFVRRELAFTAKFGVGEIAAAGQLGEPSLPENEEFVVVQGAVDMAAILPGEIWLADFKTDSFAPEVLPQKVAFYRPQLELYAKALARIYRRPVTRSWLCFLRLSEVVQL